MKPINRHLLAPPDYSFIAGEFHRKYFNVPWHVHEEYELMIILNSDGKRYVGDSIEFFFPYDMVLVGRGLPHCWLNEKLSHCKGKDYKVHYLIIQFRHDFMGKEFFHKVELQEILILLQKSLRGLKFNGAIVNRSINFIYEIINANSTNRLIYFIELLQELSVWNDVKVLSSPCFMDIDNAASEKMQVIHNYIIENMKTKISLDIAAQLINMSVSGFCKYFKKQMKKSFITVVNEFRIGYACRLLRETEATIAEICYESGFENYSNFFRQFYKIKGISPEVFRSRITNE